MKEDYEQIAIMKWASWQAWGDGKLSDYLHHSPNGGQRHIKTATRFKAMGVKAGFPDLFLFVPRGGYHGLFIELKTDRGSLSDKQKIMMDRLNAQGYRCELCRGYDSAISVIEGYLGIGENVVDG